MPKQILIAEAQSIVRNGPQSGRLASTTVEPPGPNFPEIAWRGLFADYRRAMVDTTEASDVAHFGTFWSVAG